MSAGKRRGGAARVSPGSAGVATRAPGLAWFSALVAAAAVTMLVSGCSAADRPQGERGEEVFQRYCHQCHEVEGIGTRLTRRVLESYETAEFLYAYNRSFMPYDAEGSLTDREYLDVTAHLLQRFGFAAADFELTFDNGKEVSLGSGGRPE